MMTAHESLWDSQWSDFKPGFREVIYLGGIFRGAWATAVDQASQLRLLGTPSHQAYAPHSNSLKGKRSLWRQAEFNLAIDNLIGRITG